MPALIKELYLDLALNTLPLDIRLDLILALQTAYKTCLLSDNDIRLIDAYLQGYSIEEIAVKQVKSIDTIQTALERIFLVLETVSGYRDDMLIQRVTNGKEYRQSKIPQLQRYLEDHGKDFHHAGTPWK